MWLFLNQQKQCRETQSKIQQRIQEREKELQELRKAVETLKVSTDQRRGGQLVRGFSGHVLLYYQICNDVLRPDHSYNAFCHDKLPLFF